MKEKKSQAEQRWEQQRERGFTTPASVAPEAFVEWWKGHDHCPQVSKSNEGYGGYTSGISAHKAWQVACYRLEFEERKHQHASGTGINYAYYGWHRAEDPPRRSNPDILEAHRQWCKRRKRPDPAAPSKMPELMPEVRSFDDAKSLLAVLVDKMDMNKAIGWNQADSDALEDRA